MLDDVLNHLRSSRLGQLDHGSVNRAGSANALFADNLSGATAVKSEFSNTRLGLGVMHDLDASLLATHVDHAQVVCAIEVQGLLAMWRYAQRSTSTGKAKASEKSWIRERILAFRTGVAHWWPSLPL